MSYHVWPVTGYGLIYRSGEILNDITKLCAEDEADELSEYDLTDFGANIIDDECDGLFMTDLHGEKEFDDPWIWFPCEKGASLLKQAYSSWQEIAQEFINKYRDVLNLPDLDNENWWKKHLGYVSYTQGG